MLDIKTYDLVAQIGKNIGVSNTAQGNFLYYDIKTFSYETKEIMNNGNMILLNVENISSPAVILVETMNGYISDEEQDKVYNIAGYCKYHNIEFTVMNELEFSELL